MKAADVIKARRLQRSFGDGLIAAEVKDLREPWTPHVDAILADDEIIARFTKHWRGAIPNSRRRGRPGFSAEIVLRMLILKHLRNWGYQVLQREVRANLVYRDFTGIGSETVPEARLRDRSRSVKHRLIEIGRAARGKTEPCRDKMKRADGKLVEATSRVVGQAKHFSKEIGAGMKRCTDAAKQTALEA